MGLFLLFLGGHQFAGQRPFTKVNTNIAFLFFIVGGAGDPPKEGLIAFFAGFLILFHLVGSESGSQRGETQNFPKCFDIVLSFIIYFGDILFLLSKRIKKNF